MNDGVNYFLLEKDMASAPQVAQQLFKVGRLEGKKKTGESIDEKTITVKIRILGTSRTDLENKIDTLNKALDARQQQLILHANDGRIYIADCIDRAIPLAFGSVISTVATLKFLAQVPYPTANAGSTFTMANQTFTLVSGSVFTSTTQIIAGGGNIFNRPTLVLTSGVALAWTQVQIQQLTDNQFLTITTNLPSALNDFLTIVCDPNAANGFTVTKNGTATLCQINGIFPVMEPGNTSWIIQITAASAPQASCQWSWTSRWIS